MSVKLKEINEALETLSTEWNWDFAYAPKPGQQRIKITAHHKTNPTEAKVIVLSEDLFKKLPVTDVARNIVRLLPSIPNSTAQEVTPSEPTAPLRIKPAAPVTAERRYERLRVNYRRNVIELKTQAAPVPVPDWTANFGRTVSRFFAGVSRRFAN